MTASTGQTLRRVGLLIEAVSMFGILSLGRGNLAGWKNARIDPSLLFPLIILLGLVMWATGSWVLYQHRNRS